MCFESWHAVARQLVGIRAGFESQGLIIQYAITVIYEHAAILRHSPSVKISKLTYLDLGPPVPLGTSGDEKPPSITVTGDPAGSMPADTHLFKVFVQGEHVITPSASPLSSAVFGHPVHCCMCRSFLRQSENVASHFPSPCFNNVLESLRACSIHHLFICDMVAPRDAEYCTQGAEMKDI